MNNLTSTLSFISLGSPFSTLPHPATDTLSPVNVAFFNSEEKGKQIGLMKSETLIISKNSFALAYTFHYL